MYPMNVHYNTPQRTRQSYEKRDAESFKKRYIKINLYVVINVGRYHGRMIEIHRC